MKNANEQSAPQLPILFTSRHVQSETVSGGVISMLLKWDAEITNKIEIDESELDELNLSIQKLEQEHQNFRSLLLEEMIGRESTLDKQQLVETVFVYFVRLLDAMSAYTTVKDATNNINLTAKKMCQQFYQTFQFIEELFGSYINKELKAPASFAEIDKVEIVKNLKRVKGAYIHSEENRNSLMDTDQPFWLLRYIFSKTRREKQPAAG